MSQPLSKRRRFILSSILLVGSIAFSLFVAEVALTYYHDHIRGSNQREPGLIDYDPTLGWKLTKNWTGKHRHYDFDVEYATNQYGFRGRFDSKRTESDRIYAFVGDSFTFSYGVSEGETFVDRLNETSNENSDVFYNFGVPGYSTDQELLLIRSRVFTFEPDVIFLVVYLFNDLIDNEHPFPVQSNHAKPYFEITPSGLELRNVPVPSATDDSKKYRTDHAGLLLGNNAPDRGPLFDYLSRFELTRLIAPYFEKQPQIQSQFDTTLGSSIQLFNALADQIQQECVNRGVELRLVLMPGRSFVEHPASMSAQYQDYIRERLVRSSTSQDLQVLDLAAYLKALYEKEGTRLYHPNEGHLNIDGHRAVADFMANQL